MAPHDLLTMYSAKGVEYLIAIAYLVLFVPFWRFVNKERIVEPGLAAGLERWMGQMVEWFHVPGHVCFHPGHAWVRVEDPTLVSVGMDDFAHKLVGRKCAIKLPAVGTQLVQGEPGWSLGSDSNTVDMLSPVDGTVVAVNERLAAAPAAGSDDPYGDGWLLKLRAPRLEANRKHLLSGSLATRWMQDVCERLGKQVHPSLGQVYQDGGLPIDGMARGLSSDNWTAVAREFLLT